MKKWFLILVFVLFIIGSIALAIYSKNIVEQNPEENPELRYQYVWPKPWYRKTWFYITSYVLILSVVGLFVFGFPNLTSYRRERRRNKLIKFIAKRDRQGETSGKIISELKNLGYRSEYIEDALYRYKYKRNNKESTFKRVAIFFALIKGLRKFKTLGEIKSKLLSKGYDAKDIDYYFHLYSKKREEENTRYELSKSNLPKILRRAKRNFRRKMLIIDIDKGLKLGKDSSRIRENLLNRGYLQRHIEDAVCRYKQYIETGRYHKPNKKVHFRKMVKNIIKEDARQGKSYEEILDDLVINGIRAEKAKPFLEKYYHKYKKNQNSE